MGLPDQATVAAMVEAVHTWGDGRGNYAVWERSMESCRGLFARIFDVQASEVGLLPSVVPAVSAAATTISRGRGMVVAHRREFRSLLLPVLAQVEESRMRWVDGPYVADTFIAAVDDATDAVVVSAVSSHDGGRPSLNRLAATCRAADAQLVVDGTQAAGIVVPDVRVSELSLFACAGYKGLRAPRGVAFAVADDCHVQNFRAPSAYGTADSEERGTYGPPLVPKRKAPGLDQSPAWLAWVGAEQALEGLASESAADREARVVALTDLVRTRLAERGLLAQQTDLPSPIVTFAVDDPDALVANLARGGVRSVAKLGRLRLGFHVYNDENDVDLVCDLLET
jgi:selenocysteine lyase/cysteine desulfurase